MKTQTFEDLIEKEYQFERKGMCLTCTYYCWLHNHFIHCRLLEESYGQEINNSSEWHKNISKGYCSKSPDNYSPETKPEVTEVEGYKSNDISALRKSPLYKDKDSGLHYKNKMKGDKQ